MRQLHDLAHYYKIISHRKHRAFWGPDCNILVPAYDLNLLIHIKYLIESNKVFVSEWIIQHFLVLALIYYCSFEIVKPF